MIYFKCEQCHEQLEAPASIGGDVLPCPGCGYQMKIPSEEKIEIPDDDAEVIPQEENVGEPLPEPSKDISGFRELIISANGEMVLNEDRKSLKCPVQQGKRCEYRCAWFRLDSRKNIATCQDHIIGHIIKNNYKGGGH